MLRSSRDASRLSDAGRLPSPPCGRLRSVPPPQPFLDHLRLSGYHPRSDKHSNALAEAIVTDLIDSCSVLADKAHVGDVVYDINFDLVYGTAQWNVDLVLGSPPPHTGPPVGDLILRATPSTVEIAIELKTVMTEHRKAVKNRKRDFEAHHEHVHNYSPNAVAGGVLVVNIAGQFYSPLRQPDDITNHGDVVPKVEHCLAEMRAVSVRGGPTGYGLDAKSAIVVDMNNMELGTTKYHTAPPAPPTGDPLEYDAFIQRLCAEWRARFGG